MRNMAIIYQPQKNIAPHYPSPRHIAIVGGGIGGLSCAIALAQTQKFEIDLYEQTAHFNILNGGTGVQLSPNAVNILKKLKINLPASKIQKPIIASLYDWHGQIQWQMPLNPKCEQKYGAPYIHIHRADLHHALLCAAQNAKVRIHMNQKIQNYNSNNNQITLQAQSITPCADMLIAADGINSTLRTRITQNALRYSGFHAWRAIINTDNAQNIIPTHANLWMGDKRHAIAYYLRGGKIINLVAIVANSMPPQKQNGNINQLQTLFADAPEPLHSLVQICKTASVWGIYDTAPLKKWYDGRCVLLGDAAHAMPPFFAQGAAMAIEDAAMLAYELEQNATKPKTNIENIFKRYQNHRSPRTQWMQKATYTQARLYHMPKWNAPIRNLALRLGSHAIQARINKIYGWKPPMRQENDANAAYQ